MLDNSLTDSPKSSASTQMKTMALLARLMVERNCSGKQMAYHRSREMKARCWRCPVMASSTQQAHVFADVLGRAGALYGPRGVTEPPAPAPAATPAQRPAPWTDMRSFICGPASQVSIPLAGGKKRNETPRGSLTYPAGRGPSRGRNSEKNIVGAPRKWKTL